MSQIDPESLFPSDRMIEGVIDGNVTQIHRGRQYADEGDTFTIDGVTFEIVAVEERMLGDLTDNDAQAEGFRDLEQYREILNRAHDGFEWDETSEIVRHKFTRQ